MHTECYRIRLLVEGEIDGVLTEKELLINETDLEAAYRVAVSIATNEGLIVHETSEIIGVF